MLFFYDIIGHHMEVYIDDIVVKSKKASDHVVHLRKSFERIRIYHLKLNPLKCNFSVQAGNFLGFLIHQKGVEIDKNKVRAVLEAKLPQTKREPQRFLGQVNYLKRFISNLAGKTKEFFDLLKLRQEAEFKWEERHQYAFDKVKNYLSKPPILISPREGVPLRLYI